MDDPKAWRQLASQFRKIEIGWPKLRANWTSSQWDVCGEQWYLSGVKDPRIHQNFKWAAERGAVLHRGRAGPDAWLYWLDLLRLESPRYGGSRSKRRTDDPEESEFGQIENVCVASAEYCFKLGTKAIENNLKAAEDRATSQSQVGAEMTFPGSTPITQANRIAVNQEARAARGGRWASTSARRNTKYVAIDEALKKIAEARPKNHQEVFRFLEARKVAIPKREPFKTAGGWLKGFQQKPHLASAWLSQAWARLGLPAFARGPKK